MTVAATSVAAVTERRAQGITHWLNCHYESAPERPRPERADTMFLAMDGCMLRVVEYIEAGRLGRTDVAPDVKVRRDRWVDTRLAKARRHGDVEGSFVCSHDDFDTVLTQLVGAARTRGLPPDTQLVFLGDGGNGLMEAAKRHFPEAQYILDRCHLRQHLCGVAQHLQMPESDAKRWVATNSMQGSVPEPHGRPSSSFAHSFRPSAAANPSSAARSSA